jgi:hypothetical protein
MSTTPTRSKKSAPTKEWTLPQQIYEVLGEMVPQEVRDQAALEFTRCNPEDQKTVNEAGLRAVQHFIDFFAEAFHGRPEITEEGIRNAAIFMAQGTIEELKELALKVMGGFGPDPLPSAPIVRH